MGQQQMGLYLDEGQNDKYGFGHVDFLDGSAPIVATAYFTIINSMKAAYDIDDILKGMEEKLDGAIRTYLGGYKIDDVNHLKVQFDTARILNGEVVIDHETPRIKTKEDSRIYMEILKDWGTEINTIVISDIVLSDDQKEIRRELLKAEKAVEIAEQEVKMAKFEKERVIIVSEGKKKSLSIEAEGRKEALMSEGKGMSSQISSVKSAGINSSASAAYLAEMKKWDSIGDKTVIIDGGSDSLSGMGAKFASGSKAFSTAVSETSEA